jgi:hypothetical protein
MTKPITIRAAYMSSSDIGDVYDMCKAANDPLMSVRLIESSHFTEAVLVVWMCGESVTDEELGEALKADLGKFITDYELE